MSQFYCIFEVKIFPRLENVDAFYWGARNWHGAFRRCHISEFWMELDEKLYAVRWKPIDYRIHQVK